jgi:hypothetical protein
VVVVITLVLAVTGSLLAPSDASTAAKRHRAIKILRVTKTVTATATVTAPGPTATVTVPGPTATVTVPGPTATVTVPGPTATVTVPGPTVTLPTGGAVPSTAPSTQLLSDFGQQYSGLYTASGQLLGAGVDSTVYLLPPHTSTKTDPSTGSNLLNLMRAGGMGADRAATVNVGGFTLEGTDQLSSLAAYGGMLVGYGTGSTIHDLKVTGIPGYSSAPPGETMALSLWHSDSASLRNVTLDGDRSGDGAQVGATLLGYNYTTGTHTISNLKATNARYGFGIAMWKASGSYTFDGGCNLSHNRKAINIESSIGGTVYNFNGCDFRGTTGAPFVAQVTSIDSSSKVYFRDPVVDSWPLKVNCYGPAALGGTNKQLDSDIHLIIHGVDVSGDPTKLQITHM